MDFIPVLMQLKKSDYKAYHEILQNLGLIEK